MQVVPARLSGVLTLLPEPHRDERGLFTRTFDADDVRGVGIDPASFVQDSQSRSRRGVVRGMHGRVGTGEAKLVRVAHGAVFDVVVDIRVGSPTYGCWDSVLLDDRDRRSIYLSAGLAHGFVALKDSSTVMYLCSEPYAPQREHTIDPTDADIGIAWPIPAGQLRLSGRDASAPSLAQACAAGILPTWTDYQDFVAGLPGR